ncbi:Gypsy retrotransposon integrase-like protein 1, partial [Mucuna pruriens]
MALAKQFEEISFHYVPRDKNQMADALATLSAMLHSNQDKEMAIHIKEDETDGKPWYHDIKECLKKGAYPLEATENDKQTLKRLATGFFLSGVIIYKKSVDSTLLHCIDDQEAWDIMEGMHEGAFGTHANGHALARKILRAEYYWSKMESDCCQHVKRCVKCQMYADNIHVAPSALYKLTSPWPFSVWGLDMIGPIEPKASNGHRFILAAIDYFTKWVEAASYANVTKSMVIKFIKRDIICSYGVPTRIITDNGANLNNKMMTELFERFKIKHHNSTPYCPNMNEAVEAANKNIKKIVQKMVVTYRDWHDMLPYALHGYQTSVRTSAGATPYSLVYGTEAVLSIEVEIPSLRVMAEAEINDSEWVQSRLDQLNLIEEKRLTVICHDQLYQRRIKNTFDKRVRPQVFKEGDLVLKRKAHHDKDPRGKWAPNYEGPCIVKHAFSGGALVLTDSEGQELKHPVNTDVVKRFYP